MTDNNSTPPASGVRDTWGVLGTVLVQVTMLPGWNPPALTQGHIDSRGNIDVQFGEPTLAEAGATQLGLNRRAESHDDRFAHWDGTYAGHPLTIVAQNTPSPRLHHAVADTSDPHRYDVLPAWARLGACLTEATASPDWDENAFTAATVWGDGELSVQVDGEAFAARMSAAAGLSDPPERFDDLQPGHHFVSWNGDYAGHRLRVSGYCDGDVSERTDTDQQATPLPAVHEYTPPVDADLDVDEA